MRISRYLVENMNSWSVLNIYKCSTHDKSTLVSVCMSSSGCNWWFEPHTDSRSMFNIMWFGDSMQKLILKGVWCNVSMDYSHMHNMTTHVHNSASFILGPIIFIWFGEVIATVWKQLMRWVFQSAGNLCSSLLPGN